MLWFLVYVLFLTEPISSKKFDYNGYKLYQFKLEDTKLCDMIGKLENDPGYDFWLPLNCAGYNNIIMVAPSQQKIFETLLKATQVPFDTSVGNMKTMIENEEKQLRMAHRAQLGNITFDVYYRYEEIMAYMLNVASKHSDIVKLKKIGGTIEGRDLMVMKISEGKAGRKPGIFIDAGIHAREWISPATALYVIHQLVENQHNRPLLKNVDWYILPLMNPDGYEYTHTNRRLWRKNRQRNLICVGTDLNRNFDYKFGQQGTSINPCSQIFPGRKPFSAPETKAVKDFLLSYKGKIKLYLTLHSYSEVILVPWAADGSKPKDDKEIRALAAKARDAISAVSGTKYEIGTPIETIGYSASGGSDDWAKAVAGIELSYCFELSPKRGSSDGFVLPPSQIRNVTAEVFAGIRAFHKHVEMLSL